jgi:hypothetical protein
VAIAVLDRTGFPAGLKFDARLDVEPGFLGVLRDLFDSQPSEVEQPKRRKAIAATPAVQAEIVEQANVEPRSNGRPRVIDGEAVDTERSYGPPAPRLTPRHPSDRR